MADARTGSTGVVENGGLSSIVDDALLNDYLVTGGAEDITFEDNREAAPGQPAQPEQAELPAYPNVGGNVYVPPQGFGFDASKFRSQPEKRQENQQPPQHPQQPKPQQQQRPDGRQVEERVSEKVDEVQEQERKPISMRDVRSDTSREQLYNTTNVRVPSYEGMLPFEQNIDLVSRGEQPVSMEQTYDTMANFLDDVSFSPTVSEGGSRLEAQAVERESGIAAENDERRIEEAADETQATQIANRVESATSSYSEGHDINEVSADYEPRLNEFEYYDLPTTQFKQTQEETKESTAAAVAGKSWDGNAFTEKAVADNDVRPCDVSIGSLVIGEIVREPGNNLISIVNKVTGSSFTVEQILTYEGMTEFARVVNSANIDVVATKSPVVGPSDVQSRKLRIHFGRGIKIHSSQTKSWNLDFDGDGISISFDVHDWARSAMNYLVNANRKSMIDVDFFPISSIDRDRDIYIEEFKLGFLPIFQDEFGIDITNLAGAMYEISNPSPKDGEDDDTYLNRVWCNALEEMKSIADKFANPDVAMSAILQDIFDQMTTLRQYEIADMAIRLEQDEFSEPDGPEAIEEVADVYLRDVLNSMAAGQLPPNFQDFITGLHQYIGEVPNKNVGFRIGAKYAKVIKASQLTFKGDMNSYKLIYRLTLQAGEAMFMSGRATIGERVAYMQRIARNKVEAEVGFPKNYRSTALFLKRFKESWNKQMRLIECSNFGGFACDLDPVPDPDRKTFYIGSDKLSDFVKALISVYGDYTIEFMFPKLSFTDYIEDGSHSAWENKVLTLLEAYRTLTLKELKNNNKLDIPVNVPVVRTKKSETKEGEAKKGESKKERVQVPFYDMLISDAQPSHILFSIASKRTSSASEYNKNSLEPLLKNFVACIKEAKDRYKTRHENRADFIVSMNEMMAALHLSGSSMFNYFGMSDPLSFFEGEYGRSMLDAVVETDKHSYVAGKKFRKFDKTRMTKAGLKTATSPENAIGGIRATMVFNYKLRRIDRINTEIKRLLETTDPEEIASCLDSSVHTVSTVPIRLNALQNELESEFDALASCSALWNVLVREMRDGDNSAFMTLISSEGRINGIWSDANDREKGCGFWYSDYLNNGYNSLTDVINDPTVPKNVKEQIAVDVVRVATGFTKYKAYEMSYQLELEADASYTSMNLLAYNEQPSVITEIQEANRKLKKRNFYKKNLGEVVADVRAARKMAERNSGMLNAYMETLAEDLDFQVEIPSEFVADAIEAQMDKTSRASEKAHQEIQVDGLFNALMLQRGGLTDAVYRTEARSINMIADDMLSSYDLVRVLADPDLEIMVYNGTTRWPLSRKTLCGDNSEKALWDMLENNPRIACLLRAGIVSSGNKGQRVYKNAKASFYNSMIELSTNRKAIFKGKVKTELIDHPMFLSLVAMFVPIHNRNSRSVRRQHSDMFEAMQSFIVHNAYQQLEYDRSNGNSGKSFNAQSIVEKYFGVTEESLIEVGMRPESAKRWYQAIIWFLEIYVNDVCKILEKESFSKRDIDEILNSYNGQDLAFEFDLQSIALAIDCRQTFTGAKTETSTGVEGNITRNSLGVGLYTASARGHHEIIDSDMNPSELAPFVGCLTNFGVFDGTNIDELERLSGDEPLIVQAHDDYVKQDDTLDNSGFQITTLGRFLTVHRGEAAEGGNLKVKRSGDDGTDSITKFKRYDENSADNIGLVMRAYVDAEEIDGVNNKLFQARLTLAKILMETDNAEGYDDADLSDYMDLAEVMVKEIAETSELSELNATNTDPNQAPIVIRSIGEISAAIRNNMEQSIVENGSPKDIRDAAIQIADNVGMDAPLSGEDATNAALLAFSQIQADPAIREFKAMAKPSEGTFERNFNTFSQLIAIRAIRLPWSGKVLNKNDLLGDGKKHTEVYPFTQDMLESRASHVFNSGIDGWTKPKGFNEKPRFGKKKDLFFYCPINITRKKGSKKKSVTTNISPGPQSVWVIEEGASEAEIEKAITTCYSFGMTLAFRSTKALGSFKEHFVNDVTEAPFGDDYLMIPFFNILQSGGAINPPMAPGSFLLRKNNYSLIVEDSYNFFSLGDSHMLTDSRTAREIQCTASNVEPMSIRNMFYNVLNDTTEVNGKRVCDMVTDIRLASWDEVKRDIVDYADDGPSFDLGLSATNQNIEDVVQKFGLQIEEYRKEFSSADKNGILPYGKPDRIIGWMRCTVGSGEDKRPIYAPIIPFPTGTKLSAPTRFEIVDVSPMNGGGPKNNIDISWRISESMEGQIVKVHDGTNAAGKNITILVNGINLGNLVNGLRVDHMIAAETNSSRKIATEPRLSTMVSLARMAKVAHDFNFADSPGAFPDNQYIKQQLQNEYIPMGQWENINKMVSRYHEDDRIDAFVRRLVEDAIATKTTNPTDLLACRFNNINGKVIRYIDYEFFFDADDDFENDLLRFYHEMIPELCPPSIDSYGDGVNENGDMYIFKPVTDMSKEFQYGCLQVLTSFPDPDGDGKIWVWNNAYLGLNFYNDEFTGLHKPGLNGSHMNMEQVAAMAISGYPITGKEMKLFSEYAISPSFKNYNSYEVHLDRGQFLRKKR